MTETTLMLDKRTDLVLPNLQEACHTALQAAQRFRAMARDAVAGLVKIEGRIDAGRLETEQFAAHGFAWLATYVTGLEQMLAWAERLEAKGALGELEALMLQAAFGEYLQQLTGGICSRPVT